MDKYQPEEEHPRPEYIARLHGVEEKTVNFVTQTTEPRVPFWSRKFPGWLVPQVSKNVNQSRADKAVNITQVSSTICM